MLLKLPLYSAADAVKAQWAALVAAVQALMASGAGPDDPQAQALARHWLALFRAYAGDNPVTQQKIRTALANEPGLTAGGFVTPAMRDFMRAAMQAMAAA